MRIESTIDGRCVVARGDENWPQYFSFYVDGDKSSGTKYLDQAQRHPDRPSAEETLRRLRHRAQIRRDKAKRVKEQENG